jgi:hypothetical protein
MNSSLGIRVKKVNTWRMGADEPWRQQMRQDKRSPLPVVRLTTGTRLPRKPPGLFTPDVRASGTIADAPCTD